MRAPVDTIPAPPIPSHLPWVNVASLRMDKQAGRPVLIEFFDFCRVSSMRTLPYVKAWHDRYEGAGLRVISVHCPGYPPSHDADAARDAVQRLGIVHPVVLDQEFELWGLYENRGWPARYLFDQRLRLFEIHYGEGGYVPTEQAIQELLGIDEPLLDPLHPEDDPDALIAVPTPEHEGAYSGPYEAGGVWAVVGGEGELIVNGERFVVEAPGAIELIAHESHTSSDLELEPGEGVTVYATVFTPGVASPGEA
jgi:hypothetical protein